MTDKEREIMFVEIEDVIETNCAFPDYLKAFRELRARDKELSVRELQSQNYYDMMVDVVDGDTVFEQIVNIVRDLACALVVGTFFREMARSAVQRTTEADFDRMVMSELHGYGDNEPSEDETRKFYAMVKFYQQECESWINSVENN